MNTNAHPSHRLFLAAAAGERPGTRRPARLEDPGGRLPGKASAPQHRAGWALERALDLAQELHKLQKAEVAAR
ncbi:hypothetical protein [Limisphaera sp. VF-2]|jgi:hypothetical protein|uniref:hypothetical protein n=1 Tax=Limisphaera sp. VF-2 TaxID=3400418 RepID=UPI001754EB12